jgi:hypothetical protein
MWGPPEFTEEEEYAIPTRILWFAPECRSQVTADEISALRDEGIIAIFTSYRPEFVVDTTMVPLPPVESSPTVLRLHTDTPPDEKS